MSLYILYINEGYFHKRYCVVYRDSGNTVLSTDSKCEIKKWIDSIGLKILHYHSYDRILEKNYNSMKVYLGFPNTCEIR